MRRKRVPNWFALLGSLFRFLFSELKITAKVVRKQVQKVTKRRRCSEHVPMVFGSHLKGLNLPQWLQDGPKMAQTSPKITPESPKKGQGEPKMAPECLKMVLIRPKMEPKWNKMLPRKPGVLYVHSLFVMYSCTGCGCNSSLRLSEGCTVFPAPATTRLRHEEVSSAYYTRISRMIMDDMLAGTLCDLDLFQL